jgi:hypothetical protein
MPWLRGAHPSIIGATENTRIACSHSTDVPVFDVGLCDVDFGICLPVPIRPEPSSIRLAHVEDLLPTRDVADDDERRVVFDDARAGNGHLVVDLEKQPVVAAISKSRAQ